MDQKLVEMLVGLVSGQGREQVLKEVVELMDPRTKKRVFDNLKIKTLASLKAQRSTIEEALKRYGSE